MLNRNSGREGSGPPLRHGQLVHLSHLLGDQAVPGGHSGVVSLLAEDYPLSHEGQHVRVELSDERAPVEGVSCWLVVVPERFVVQLEFRLAVSLVATESVVDFLAIGGLEHAKDGVEHEDECMNLLWGEGETLEGLVLRETRDLCKPARVLPVVPACAVTEVLE